MTVRLFDTFQGGIREFDPIDPKKKEVRMYTCGPTVYDYAHIGNFRAFVFEDLLRRFLEFKDYKVKHVMNLTDVDDKTIAGASREKKRLEEFTEKYTQAFFEDLKTLNILAPNHPAEPPRATREIPAMIELIEKLVKKRAAYASDGSVYYRVSAFPNYGKLSKKKLAGNIVGARVDVDEYDKEEGADFVLWKKAKEGEPSWDSSWGKGRPGWHIECSAMSMKYLGETFDIHAGGEDLIFPHHENEIAQSEAATGKKFVHYWLHCKHLLVNGEKMSKSKGNFYTLRDLLAKGHDPMAIRYSLLSVHYRQPLNFTLEGLKAAAEVIARVDECYFRCLSLLTKSRKVVGSAKEELKPNLNHAINDMADKLDEDLNISLCLNSFFSAVKVINRRIEQGNLEERDLKAAINFFKQADELLGLSIASLDSIPEEIVKIVKQRADFRSKKDFLRTDQLRKEIEEKGWLIKDGRPGEPSTVKKKRSAWD